jgi:hypothetical protein
VAREGPGLDDRDDGFCAGFEQRFCAIVDIHPSSKLQFEFTCILRDL